MPESGSPHFAGRRSWRLPEGTAGGQVAVPLQQKSGGNTGALPVSDPPGPQSSAPAFVERDSVAG